LRIESRPDLEKNLDFGRLVSGPQALFLLIRPQEVKRLKPITACLIMQLMAYLTRQPLRGEFLFYLDELCNAGRIPGYAEYISLVRSQGIAMIQCIQDFGQLRREYGADDAATILSNSNTKVFFPGTGKQEAEFASELLGDTTVKTSSLHRGRKGLSDSVSYARRRLMTPDEVRRMEQGELLVIAANLAPMRLRARPYFQVCKLRKRINLPIVSPGSPSQAPGQPTASPSVSSPAGGLSQKARQVITLVSRWRPGGPGQGQVKP
jgi:type IV secretion system protein VirD4